ncbi:MAG: putative dienelactone hydrolase [Glaciecola sp.]|jgi:predicted dienelactone hydrolase
MSYNLVNKIFLMVIAIALNMPVFAKNRIDTQRPDAPTLAAYGKFDIGVQTLKIVHPEQIDIVKIDPAKAKPDKLPTYDRPLTLEIWYPATPGNTGTNTLDVYLRDGKTKVELHGKAVREAIPLKNTNKYPLVLISHGYPGNRFLLAHLAENIASKGYVVVSIDHTDSTYRTYAAFASTLINRPLDQLFTLNQVAMLSKDESSFLFNLVDTDNTALIGYSMGAYGAMVLAGGGLTQQAVDYPWAAPHNTLAIHKSDSEQHNSLADPRLKTVIAFAPWGMNVNMWDKTTLKGVNVPTLFVAGSVDDVSGYKKGIRAIWQATTSVERSLLTFENANHSAGAPMPAPEEAYVYSEELGIHLSDHYTDPVWDSARMNNISQHFATAWLEKHLKQDTSMNQYLQLIPNSNDGLWSMDEQNKAKNDHTHWAGFKARTAKGLKFESLNKGP